MLIISRILFYLSLLVLIAVQLHQFISAGKSYDLIKLAYTSLSIWKRLVKIKKTSRKKKLRTRHICLGEGLKVIKITLCRMICLQQIVTLDRQLILQAALCAVSQLLGLWYTR